MSVSTSVSSSSLLYPSSTNESPWEQVASHANPQNETHFLVNDALPYSTNPVNCNGGGAIYAPKLANSNNVNCINGHNLYFNPPTYTNTGAPNILLNQDVTLHKTYNGIHNPVMAPNIRNGQVIGTVNTWGNQSASGDRMITRPTWNLRKPTSGGVKKPKRIRTAFTSQQMMELENEYGRTRYLDRSRRIELSEILSLNERTIKIWFQNRRMKEKKDRAESIEDTEATSTTESSPDCAPMQMMMYERYPLHNTHMGGLDRGDYVEHFNPTPNSIPMQNIGGSMVLGCHDVNSYPAFVLDNLQLSELRDSGPLSAECQQINMQMQECVVNDHNSAVKTLKEEMTENSSTHSERSLKECEEEQNWDLSWIRSIHMED